MTLHEFSALTRKAQHQEVMRRAVFVHDIASKDAWSLFFSLDGFYIEAVLRVGEADVSQVVPFVRGEADERMLKGGPCSCLVGT